MATYQVYHFYQQHSLNENKGPICFLCVFQGTKVSKDAILLSWSQSHILLGLVFICARLLKIGINSLIQFQAIYFHREKISELFNCHRLPHFFYTFIVMKKEKYGIRGKRKTELNYKDLKETFTQWLIRERTLSPSHLKENHLSQNA